VAACAVRGSIGHTAGPYGDSDGLPSHMATTPVVTKLSDNSVDRVAEQHIEETTRHESLTQTNVTGACQLVIQK
jgi:hypothetical protein